jgi:hypothetical protein
MADKRTPVSPFFPERGCVGLPKAVLAPIESCNETVKFSVRSIQGPGGAGESRKVHKRRENL